MRHDAHYVDTSRHTSRTHPNTTKDGHRSAYLGSDGVNVLKDHVVAIGAEVAPAVASNLCAHGRLPHLEVLLGRQATKRGSRRPCLGRCKVAGVVHDQVFVHKRDANCCGVDVTAHSAHDSTSAAVSFALVYGSRRGHGHCVEWKPAGWRTLLGACCKEG